MGLDTERHHHHPSDSSPALSFSPPSSPDIHSSNIPVSELEDPISLNAYYNMWQKTAIRNAKIYRNVFPVVPVRSSMSIYSKEDDILSKE